MAHEAVVGLLGGEVMPPGIAVTLWVEPLGVDFIDVAIDIIVADPVVRDIDRFAFESGGEVPEEAVVYRSRSDARTGTIASAEQSEFLFEQVRQLVGEGEEARGHRKRICCGARPNRRIL